MMCKPDFQFQCNPTIGGVDHWMKVLHLLREAPKYIVILLISKSSSSAQISHFPNFIYVIQLKTIQQLRFLIIMWEEKNEDIY